MQVSTPDGRTVDVRRRLLPWQPRRRLGYEPGDASDGDLGGDSLVGIVVGILFVVVIPLLVVVGALLVELPLTTGPA